MPRSTLAVLSLLLGLMGSPAQAADPASDAPLVVGHRGLIHHAPENTLAAFRACLNLRVGFEFDVAKTQDGQLVCIHDDTLERTTNGTGKVSERTLEELRRLDAGSRFDPRFTGEKIPTIEEVIQLIAEYKSLDVLITADLKASGVEREVVRLAEKYQVLHRILFIGTTIVQPEVRKQLKAASRNARTAAVANTPEEFPQALEATDADWVYLRFLPTPAQMDTVRQRGKQAFIAGKFISANQPENWRKCQAVGVAGILTDFPLEMAKTFRAKAKP